MKQIYRKHLKSLGVLNSISKEPLQITGEDITILKTPSNLILLGEKEDFRAYLCKQLTGGKLLNFRFARKLFHSDLLRNAVISSLISSPEQVKSLLVEIYGPFSYCRFESAFDEYIISMREEYGVVISDQQVLHHAKVSTIDELLKRGYNSKHAYIHDMVAHNERDAMLQERGGLSYEQWLEKEVEKYASQPGMLITKRTLIFENLFPKVVTISPSLFIEHFQKIPLQEALRLFYSKKISISEVGSNSEACIVTGLPLKYLSSMVSQ